MMKNAITILLKARFEILILRVMKYTNPVIVRPISRETMFGNIKLFTSQYLIQLKHRRMTNMMPKTIMKQKKIVFCNILVLINVFSFLFIFYCLLRVQLMSPSILWLARILTSPLSSVISVVLRPILVTVPLKPSAWTITVSPTLN